MLSSFYGANRTTNLPTCFGCASVIYGKNALDSKKMKEMSGTPAVSNGNVGRIALATAALIATGAVSYALISRSTQPAPATPQTEVAQQDIGASITQLEAKLKANPNDANGWRMLGWSLFETGKFAESAQAYRRATQLSPDKGEYWSSLGEALTLAGGGNVPAIAKQAFDKAVALDPKDPRARYFLAVEKDIAGDHKGAIEAWIALLKDTPPGAPWEADLRRVVGEVAKKEGVDITGRIAAIRPAAPETRGASVATAAIPGPTASDMQAAAGMPKGQQDMMIQGMVEGLEKKLVANPDNVNGWIMLLRSRMQLGETTKASNALTDARAAFAGDQQKLGTVNAAASELGVPGR
jgi:cytochrome c-type biogenesis protein CcmH